MFENLSGERADRLQKLKAMEEMGLQAYPARFDGAQKSTEALAEAEKGVRTIEEILEKGVENTVRVAGRILSSRSHGKISFYNLRDFEGEIQLCFMEDFLGKERYKLLKKFDTADHIGVEGELFKTKHGEVTILVKEFVMLAKALRPLPEKWHGVKDKEIIYRQRYLETTMNREALNKFVFRSNFVKALREFYWQEGFIEIETPILENVSSGATAKPFVTHHNAFDIDVFLSIASGELWQKMAIVGGFEKTFEISKCFRNEGIDPSHLQEFTMVEHYAAYWNYADNMDFTERMFEHLLLRLLGTTKVNIKNREGETVEVDFKAPWPRKRFTDLIKDDCGIDVLDFDEAAGLWKEVQKKGIVIEDGEKMGYGNLVDYLYKKVSRPKLIQPTFVIEHPIDMKPLARKNDADPRLCDTFQVLVNTWEVVNAYGEIVDPLDQRARFENQSLAKAGGDEEAMMMNEEYLTAMEHGMPCMSGLGMGIDRMVTLLMGEDNLKDSVMFPLMKPLEETVKLQAKALEKARKLLKKKNG